MNEYDSLKIADIMASSHGFITTNAPENANLIVLNTCSIREKATEKIFSQLGRLKLLKDKNPDLIITIAGCVSMEEKSNIFRRAPYVDIVLGPQTLHRLPKMYEQAKKSEKNRIIDISSPKIEKFDYFPEPKKSGPIAYVSIMEGCNKYCSYCIVPYTRGIEISRPAADIISEISQLVDKGTKEIVLLGQNVNSYLDPKKKIDLAQLVHQTAKFDPIKRISFMTSHPAEFTDSLIELFANEPKLLNYLHLPIQSGSNRILKLMRRNYTRDKFQEIIDIVRKIRPNISISTDIIVGFPNETKEDFAATMEAVKDLNFDASYSFIYSQRPNTPAAKMKDNISLDEKKDRLQTLQNQLAKQNRIYNDNLVGTTQNILITERDKKNQNRFFGKAQNNRVVGFVSKNNMLGKIAQVKITKTVANSLHGELIT